MTVGERIQARRKELGITVDSLAKEIGVSRTTIYRYENGFIEKMPMNHLLPIARALHTKASYLMGLEGENSAPSSSVDEKSEDEALRYFRSLSEKRKIEALNYLRYLVLTEDLK